MKLTPFLLQIIDGRLPTGSTNLITTVVEVASGKGHALMALINVRNAAYEFNVKLSSYVATLTVAILAAVGICDT